MPFQKISVTEKIEEMRKVDPEFDRVIRVQEEEREVENNRSQQQDL